MFESISLLPNAAGKHALNIGDLAEKMLYYKTVNVFAGREEFVVLFNYFDIEVLIEYFKLKFLRVINKKKNYGVGLIGESYLADFMYLTNYDLKKIISDAYFEFSNDKEKSQKVANLLYKHIGVYDMPSTYSDDIKKELTDQAFIKQAIIKNIEYYAPQDVVKPSDFEFIVEPQTDGRLIIQSSINTVKYPLLDARSVVLNVATAMEDLKIAANYSCELSVPELNSKIISVKVNSLIEKVTKSAKDIEVFQYAQFPNAPSLRQIINEKHRSMKEFLEVLKTGVRFKEWLTELGEDNKLVKEYITKISEKSWISSAPSKAGRFYLVQGLGTILKATGTLTGIALGIGLSAANTFLVEKLFQGWKPNLFIEETIVPFINDIGNT